MHPITEVGTNVSAFLAKLWRMVEDPETNDLICWNTDGTSFMIKNQSQFAKELLPMYYKHNNMASIIRQLNMYGFHKVISAESNGLRMTDNDEISFSHPCFIRGHPYLLEHIKRKMTVTKESNEIRAAPDIMNKVLNDVKCMKGRQESLDSKLSSMKQENEALWRELSILRQKHAKQQTIVNKLIQFLVTLVHPTRNLTVKRRSNFPLMLKEKAHNVHKHSYVSESKKRHYHHSDDSDSKRLSYILRQHSSKLEADTSWPPLTNSSPTGPTIHELDPSDFLESVQILENKKRSASLLRSDSPLSPTITDCDSVDGDVSSDSPVITAKIRNNLDDGTLLDLVTEAVSPTEELITVPPEEVSPVFRGVNFVNAVNKAPTKNVMANKALEEKKCKQLAHKRELDQKLAKRQGSKAKKSTSLPVAESSLKAMLTKTKPKALHSAQKSGLKVRMPVRANISETNSKKSTARQITKRPQGMGDETTAEDTEVSQLQEVILVPDGSRIKEEEMILPVVSTPSSLPIEIREASPVGIVTMPSPVSGDLQQIFEPSPLNDSILGMPDTFFNLQENTAAASSGDSVDNQTVLSISPDDILNQVPSASPVEQNINDMALALSSPAQMAANSDGCNALSKSSLTNDFNSHVETLQNDLDCLKELLQKEGLSLDANALMGLFNSEDSMSFNPPPYPNPIQIDPSDMNQSYNQLTTYNPSSLDLTDVFHNSDWNVPMTEQNNDEDELFKDLNTPIISIPNSPTNSPLPLSSSSKRRKK